MEKKLNVILVHGLWADGSCYNAIIPTLLKEGHEVIAVQNPLLSLDEDVAATKRALARVEGPSILVGHSWGGFVITEAGNDERVKGLVYIAALVPDDGETAMDLIGKFPPTPILQHFQEAEGFIWLSKEGVQKVFARDIASDQSAVIYTTQVAPLGSLLGVKVNAAAWKTKPSWFVIANNDEVVHPDLQRFEANRMGAKSFEVEASHVAMISKPELVLNAIREADLKLREA